MWPTELLTSRGLQRYRPGTQSRPGPRYDGNVTPEINIRGDSARLFGGTPDGNAKWKFREGREGKSEKAESIEARRNSTRKRR